MPWLVWVVPYSICPWKEKLGAVMRCQIGPNPVAFHSITHKALRQQKLQRINGSKALLTTLKLLCNLVRSSFHKMDCLVCFSSLCIFCFVLWAKLIWLLKSFADEWGFISPCLWVLLVEQRVSPTLERSAGCEPVKIQRSVQCPSLRPLINALFKCSVGF